MIDRQTRDALDFAASSREEVIALVPFTVRRVVRWSECDPAGVVYTGNFSEYLLSATQLFRRHVLGANWQALRADEKIDTPAKSLSLVFEGSLWPDDVFDITLSVGDIRNRTFDFIAHAVRTDNGKGIFKGTLAAICVSAADRTIAVPIPKVLRERLRSSRNDATIAVDSRLL